MYQAKMNLIKTIYEKKEIIHVKVKYTDLSRKKKKKYSTIDTNPYLTACNSSTFPILNSTFFSSRKQSFLFHYSVFCLNKASLFNRYLLYNLAPPYVSAKCIKHSAIVSYTIQLYTSLERYCIFSPPDSTNSNFS